MYLCRAFDVVCLSRPARLEEWLHVESRQRMSLRVEDDIRQR